MKQVKISVPDMQSTHCQTRVNNAIKDINGVQIENLQAGEITVSVASESTKEEVVKAIEKAGYSVSDKENCGTSEKPKGGCCSK